MQRFALTRAGYTVIKRSGEKTKGENDATSYIAKPYIQEELLKEVKKYFI